MLLLNVLLSALLAVAQTPGGNESPPPDPPTDGIHPSLEEIFRPPTLLGLRPSDVDVSADGRFVSYRWTDRDTEDSKPDLWLVDTASGESRLLFEHDDEASVHWTRKGSLALLEQGGWFDLVDYGGDGQRRPLFHAPDGARLRWLDDGHTLVASTGADHQLWVIDLDSGERRAPAADLSDRSAWYEVEQETGLLALFARDPDNDGARGHGDRGETGHDGAQGHGDRGETGHDAARAQHAALGTTEARSHADADAPVRDEDAGPLRLHLLPLHGDGKATVLDLQPGGQLDLSPDGAYVAITRSDRPSRHDLIMADYLTEAVSTVKVRDSLAGDPAPSVSLAFCRVADGERFELPLDGAQRFSLRRSRWSPDGHWLLLDRVSEDSHVRQLLLVDPSARTVTPIFSERDEAWIGGPFLWSGWTEPGDEVLFTSERSGFNRLYALSPEGGEPRALSPERFELSRMTPIQERGQLLLTGNAADDPASSRLLLTDLSGSEPARLTGLSGWADRARVSRDGTTLIYAWATLGTPWDLWALPLSGNGTPVRLTHTVPGVLAEQHFTPPEIVHYTNPDDGVRVAAYLYRPEPFDPSRRYPAVMFVHGAGYLQQVRRSMSAYQVNMLFHQRLARLGFCVIDTDYRHSKGYGRDFRAAVYGFMGGKDLDDCVAGVDYLDSLGWVDTSRVGIYGGSYGGFMTLMALFTRPEVFACGAALRSVTDWRTYNHWYTNPRLGDPDKDAANYERSSPIDHAEGLLHPLLLLHGLKDDNVFVQDTIRLMEKLIELGKDFDAMLYPSQSHGFTDPDSWIDEYKRIERLMVRELRPGS